MKDVSRDDAVGRLLKGTLRPREGADAAGVCPDAELLAAWHEDTIDGGERDHVEKHLADCARCQAHLATMVRIEQADATEITNRESQIANAWWKWLVPAAAAASAVALWIYVQPEPMLNAPRQESTQARDMSREAAAPPDRVEEAAPPKLAVEPPPPAAVQSAPADAEARRQLEQKKTDAARDESLSAKAPREQAPPARPAPASPARTATADAQNREADTLATGRLARKDAAKPAEPPPPSAVERRERAAEGAAANAQMAARPGAAQAPAAAPPAAMAESVATAVEIRTPDPAVRWRVTGGYLIERTADGGASWQPQSVDMSDPAARSSRQFAPSLRFNAGYAPSPDICWLVGDAGTVLVTTNGRTWRRLPFPDPVNLVGVSATDARSAIVTAADSRRFATSDAGQTWSPR